MSLGMSGLIMTSRLIRVYGVMLGTFAILDGSPLILDL